MSFHVPEDYRLCTGLMGSTAAAGNNGAFIFPRDPKAKRLGLLRVVANEACPESEGWEHVSVSLEDRCPTWEEMCFVKDAFWDPEDRVLQMHPPHSEYVNHHPYCLHLWRHATLDLLEWPNPITVGPKG